MKTATAYSSASSLSLLASSLFYQIDEGRKALSHRGYCGRDIKQLFLELRKMHRIWESVGVFGRELGSLDGTS